jgi:hypothetical protein
MNEQILIQQFNNVESDIKQKLRQHQNITEALDILYLYRDILRQRIEEIKKEVING